MIETPVQTETPVQVALRTRVRELCAKYTDEYWRKVDRERAYPEEFVQALTDAGYLAALIPDEYGGAGLGVVESSMILEEVNRSGGNSGAAHAQMYTMGTLLRHGSDEQKSRYLPKIASGELRLQAFGVTEPDAGSDTTQLKTRAVRKGDKYIINGQKVFISRVRHSDLMILLARTTPLDQVKKRSDGLSVFLLDLRQAIGNGLSVVPIRTMVNHETNRSCSSTIRGPRRESHRRRGQGLPLHSRRHERRAHPDRRRVRGRRVLVRRPRRALRERTGGLRPTHWAEPGRCSSRLPAPTRIVRAADLMRQEAARLFDSGQPCGPEANMAKLLAADASWEAANVCVADARRLRLRRRVRHRAQVPRDALVPGSAGIDEPDSVLHRRARARDAEVVTDAPARRNRVVSIEQAVAAPFASRQLADFGARVIKIERPDVGDVARGYDEKVQGMASWFVWLNRSKQSLTIDLKHACAKEVLDRLLVDADVFIQNLAPGATDRIGLSNAALRAR